MRAAYRSVVASGDSLIESWRPRRSILEKGPSDGVTVPLRPGPRWVFLRPEQLPDVAEKFYRGRLRR